MSRISNGIYRVARLQTMFRPVAWAFAEREAGRIDAHWTRALAEKPKLFDGKVLMLRDPDIVATPQGDVFRGAFFDTSFRNFHAWFGFDFPDREVFNCFAMAALRTRDGAFLLGEMGPHTMNGGQIYFAAGTPDRNDIFGDRVDLYASVDRELEEETGFSPEEAPAAPDWTVLVSNTKIGCIQERRLPLTSDEALARMNDFLAADPEPEFSRFHCVKGPQDLDPEHMPDFIQAYLRRAFEESVPFR